MAGLGVEWAMTRRPLREQHDGQGDGDGADPERHVRG